MDGFIVVHHVAAPTAQDAPASPGTSGERSGTKKEREEHKGAQYRAKGGVQGAAAESKSGVISAVWGLVSDCKHPLHGSHTV